MNTVSPVVQEFFNQYARSRSAQDIGLIASQYPDSFMFAGPKGVRVAEKGAVLAAFPKGQEFLKSLGHQSTEVLTLDETRIDEHYLFVRAVFAWHFQRAPAAHIDVKVDSTFILSDQGVPKIVFNMGTKISDKRICERCPADQRKRCVSVGSCARGPDRVADAPLADVALPQFHPIGRRR
jgi:hypothetical protein